jgi:hypothetical protein
LRDAANLWAALEDAGGATLRDGRWAHPDLAPTAADLDDPIGYVERATGRGEEPSGEGAIGADLDSVLKGILDEAERSGTTRGRPSEAVEGEPPRAEGDDERGDAQTDKGGDDAR